MAIYGAFYANQSYIAKNLCVNRDKPWMHCNGHCQLNNKLASDDKKESQNPLQRASNELSLLYLPPQIFQDCFFEEKEAIPLYSYYDMPVLQEYISSTFHPPARIA
jgi:hypothetical protein